MPSLSAALAPAASKPDDGRSLPQLKEGHLFSDHLSDRSGRDRDRDRDLGGPSALSHAPVPASRGGGASKKKASAYDPSNPYFSKPSGKSKKGTKLSSGHGLDKGSSSGYGAGPSGYGGSTYGGGYGGQCSSMGVIGQGHSISGLAAAYALPPSALPPRTPNHDYDLAPPRTPGEGSLQQLSLEPGHQFAASSFGGGSSYATRHGLSTNTYNYTGGQYAKYGKRY